MMMPVSVQATTVSVKPTGATQWYTVGYRFLRPPISTTP